MLLGEGNGSFEPVESGGVGVTDTPFLADFTGNGIADSVVLDRSGNILFRAGLPGAAAGTFAPPVILNPGEPARAITILPDRFPARDRRGRRPLRPRVIDPVSSSSPSRCTRSARAGRSAGASRSRPRPCRPALAAADLTNDGFADLIAANALADSVTIAFQTSTGAFTTTMTVPTGIAPSDITFGDVTGNGLLDIIVSDQGSGDVTVLLNDPDDPFSQSLRFRAGTGFYSQSTTSAGPAVSSFAQTVSLVAGDFTGNGLADVVVVDQGTHNFSVLDRRRHRRLRQPVTRPDSTSTSDGSSVNDRPGPIVAGDFNRDGNLDLAVLMEDTGEVWIYTGNGNGTFEHTFSIPVGEEATGLSEVHGDAPGLIDLLVGNGFGDVLILVGKGDGTFQIEGSRVSLSVVPNLLGPGEAGVLVGDQANNRVTVQAPAAGGNQYTPVQTLGRELVGELSPARARRRAVGRAGPRGEFARCHRREHRQQLGGDLSHHVDRQTACPRLPRPSRLISSAPPR